MFVVKAGTSYKITKTAYSAALKLRNLHRQLDRFARLYAICNDLTLSWYKLRHPQYLLRRCTAPRSQMDRQLSTVFDS